MAPPPQISNATRLPVLEPSRWQLILALFPTIFILYLALRAIYDVYFHPLRALPGPTSWIAFPILRNISACFGNYDGAIRNFHDQYGEVVRYGPDQVSFITVSAWKDIYGHKHPQLPKALPRDQKAEDGFGKPDILNSDGPDHSRFRKALSHAFSDKALRGQEPLVKGYVDQLIEKLNGFARSGTTADMVKWYNLTTFDIIGDLAFGEPFGGLRSSAYHTWVKNIFRGFKFIPFLQFMNDFPFMAVVIDTVIPKSVKDQRAQQWQFTCETVQKRVNRTELHGRGDFMDAMLKNRGEADGLTDDELNSNANVLILAGSETTATLLSGATYWLLKTPAALLKATNEVRSAFKSEDEIDFLTTAAKLPYMLACLEEALRRYPPVPTNVPRRIPPNSHVLINGLEMPSGTMVSVHHSTASWSELNFHNPLSFHPERWLPEATKDSSSPFFNDNRAVVQPFSVGPRNCIGRNLAYNEMRLILARVLWNFDLELCEESKDWANQKTYLLWEKPELICRLKKRDAGEKVTRE